MAARWEEVRIGAHLADMKQVDYRNTLALAGLVELLVEKGLLGQDELARRCEALDRASEPLRRRPG